MHVMKNVPSFCTPKTFTDEARNKLLYVLYMDDESESNYRHSSMSNRTNSPPKIFTSNRSGEFLEPVMKYRG